jgi:hypothetical protein
MGCFVDTERVLDITSAFPGQTLYLCLDKDATDKAAQFAERYKLLARWVVVPLTLDLKYLSDVELSDLLTENADV